MITQIRSIPTTTWRLATIVVVAITAAMTITLTGYVSMKLPPLRVFAASAGLSLSGLFGAVLWPDICKMVRGKWAE